MKIVLILLLALCIGAAKFHLSTLPEPVYSYEAREKAIAHKKQFAFACSPDLASFDLDDTANIIPLLKGWGKYRMPVTVNNDSANIYFQQGINMYYGFHIIEALASFDKAVKFDTTFAMGYWGKALAYGPNINDGGAPISSEAVTAMTKAAELYDNCTWVEKAFISAMSLRYSVDTTQKREHLDQLYADAMKKMYADFPNSADAAALYADALMVQHPWDLYDGFYKPKTWTPEIVRVLEQLVKRFPENPGASHYYIHAIEGSEHPEKGLEVANRLGSMMPGLAHLVHMPSHIYIRSGYYDQGVNVNGDAVKGYYNYLSKYPAVKNNTFLYIVHNLHMQAACASMDCRYKEALKLSYDAKNSFDSTSLDAGGYFGLYLQYVHMSPFFTQIRFGKWDDILNGPPVPDSRIYANILWHYARGFAYARKHQFDSAIIALRRMRDNISSPALHESPPAFNSAMTAINVAEKILQGVIAEEQNELPQAITFLQGAVENERGMLYNEPRDWPHPARQYLGSVLLKAKQYAEAEKVYKEDLKINPKNGWSLTGLLKALLKQGKKQELIKVQPQAKKALERSDVEITGSVF